MVWKVLHRDLMTRAILLQGSHKEMRNTTTSLKSPIIFYLTSESCFHIFSLYPQQLNISVPIRSARLQQIDNHLWLYSWQCGSFQICEIKFNISIFSCKAKLLSKQCNRGKTDNNWENLSLQKVETLCHVAPEIPVILRCKCLSCFLVSVVLFKTFMRRICVQIMTWSKETQTEVHFAMHMSLFDGKIRRKMFEHFLPSANGLFYPFKLPSTFHSGAFMSSLQHTSGCLQCKAVQSSTTCV